MKTDRLIEISSLSYGFLEKLPPKQFKQVFTKLWDLRKNPRPHDSLKLKGSDFLYRADMGEYRIIYSFDSNMVTIEAVGKRNDGEIYKFIN